MKKLLLQLDASRLPSVFDRVVGHDGGADDVMSYGGVGEGDVRDLIHGAIFTRGLKDLKNTAAFIGGSDVAAAERVLAAATAAFFGPFRISLMFDPNGSNTTAVAAVAKIEQTIGDLRGRRAVITAGTGPVGMRAAGLLAKAGADVVITSRKAEEGKRHAGEIAERFGAPVKCAVVRDPSEVAKVIEGAEILLNCGPAAVMLIPRSAWAGQRSLSVAVDLNAVPPLGIEGIEVNDNGVKRDEVTSFGALGVGGLKMKIHKACIARLFERNDLVLDAETIAEVAKELG
jgi:hypothetical protein